MLSPAALDADIPGPINLHEVGELALQTINYIPSISYSILSAFEPGGRPPQSFRVSSNTGYSQLVRHKGILGPRLLPADRARGLGHGSNVAQLENNSDVPVYPAVRRRVRDQLADDDRWRARRGG